MMIEAQELTGGGQELTTLQETGKQPYRTRALLVKIPNFPCLYRHKVNGGYYAIKKVEGKQKTHAFGTTDRKIAERKLRVWLGNLDKIDTEASKTTLAGLLDKFIAGRKGMAPKTQQTEESVIKAFKADWGYGLDICVSDIRPSMVDEWLAAQEPDLMNSSYNRYALFIKQLFEVAMRDKMIAEAPTLQKSWKDPKKTARKRIVPTDEQFRAIVASIRAETQNIHAAESANFIEFIGLAGLGQAEIGALTWGDIDWNKAPLGELSCRRKKTGARFYPPIYPELKPLLEKMYAAAHKNGCPPSPATHLFTIKDARKALANACKRLTFPPFYQRSIRAYRIRTLWQKKLDIKLIAKWQGHNDGGKLILNTYTEVFGANDNDYVASELAKLSVI